MGVSGKSYNLANCSSVASTAAVSYSYDGLLHWQSFDSWPSTGWVRQGSVTASGGSLELEGNGSWGATYAYRASNLKDGDAARFAFKTDDAALQGFLSLDRGTYGGSTYRSWTVRMDGGNLKWEYIEGTAPAAQGTLMALKASTWYEGVLAIDATSATNTSESYPPRFRMVVWERDNPEVWAQKLQSFTATGWSGSDWKFVAQARSSGKSLYLDYEQEYDDGAVGRRTGMVDGSGSTSWTYTGRGQVEGESQGVTGSGSYQTRYGYNPDGSLRWMQYPGGSSGERGEKITFSYLPQKTLEGVQSDLDGGLEYVAQSVYDAAGRLVKRTLGGGGLEERRSYFDWGSENGQGRLKQITAGTAANPSLLLDLRYYSGTDTPGYDAVGNLLRLDDYKAGSPQVLEFSYDEMNRLLSAEATGGSEVYSGTYSYDANTGSLAYKSDLGDYVYGDSSHAHAVTAAGSARNYAYDANGNQVGRSTGNTYTLAYDGENRLASIGGAATASFVYDGDGQRVKGTVGGVTTVFVGEHYQVSGSAVTKYYFAAGSRVALRTQSGVRYLFGDHLGSTSVTADVSGGNVSRQLYKAWGETRGTGRVATEYGYTGQYGYENDFGLLFYRARWYDPYLTQFSQPDTLVPDQYNPLDWNRYLYARANPIRYNDPSGHCPICIIAVLVIGSILLTGDTPSIGPGDAANVIDLVADGLQHEEHANIVGGGLQSLQNDPDVKAAQSRLIDRITNEPEYRKQAYSYENISDKFVADGPSGNWKEAARTGNQAFWMVRGGTIYATNTTVSADGTIATTWHIHDHFDFIPGPERSEEYNYWAKKIYFIYNELLGAEESFPTDAYWDETIPPRNNNSTPK